MGSISLAGLTSCEGGNGQPPKKEAGNPEWGSGFPGGRSVEYGE
jgi:hypothetical protein